MLGGLLTPPLYTALESQVLVTLERNTRVSVAGWVSVKTLVGTLPERPQPRELDAVVRRLARRGQVEILMERFPASVPFQALRRIGSP